MDPGDTASFDGWPIIEAGQKIVTVSLDDTARVWTAATPEQVADWQEHESENAPGLMEKRPLNGDVDQIRR